ncbi:MAG: hypothetical protein LBI33_13040, partial [Propionibacteriaceae bacterium]|nr:hypothetical protein [Propionibacteriaceae bacterium]
IPADLAFEFTVTPTAVDGATDTSAAPVIGNAGKVSVPFGTGATKDTTGDIERWHLESHELFGGITWPHAGVYTYAITETPGTYTLKPDVTEEITYSQARYEVNVYVGEVSGALAITAIGAVQTIDGSGEPVAPEDQAKVDPTPGGNPGLGYTYSQMIFLNQYVKTEGGTTPTTDKNWTLAISKTVQGDYSDTSAYFPFHATVTAPTLSSVTAFTAYVVAADPATAGQYIIVTTADNYAGAIAGGKFTVASGSNLDVNLKHGQSLVFVDTPVGTRYTVSEDGTTAYTAKATVTEAGITGGRETGGAGLGLTLPAASNAVYQGTLYVGEGPANSADFVNDRGDITATGISLDNLPYYLLIALVALSLGAYVVVRFRKAAQARH